MTEPCQPGAQGAGLHHMEGDRIGATPAREGSRFGHEASGQGDGHRRVSAWKPEEQGAGHQQFPPPSLEQEQGQPAGRRGIQEAGADPQFRVDLLQA
ncbi:MAG: hypothetical protein ACK56I_33275, partial [bacterium]